VNAPATRLPFFLKVPSIRFLLPNFGSTKVTPKPPSLTRTLSLEMSVQAVGVFEISHVTGMSTARIATTFLGFIRLSTATSRAILPPPGDSAPP
jgi:hypothetical protein